MVIHWSITTAQRAQVVLLASLDAKFRQDAQLAGPQVCSVAVDDASAAEARRHDVPPLEVRSTAAIDPRARCGSVLSADTPSASCRAQLALRAMRQVLAIWMAPEADARSLESGKQTSDGRMCGS